MRRTSTAGLLVAVLLAAACSGDSPVGTRTPLQPSAVNPDLGLGDRIAQLIPVLYPNGLETAAGTRWDNIRGKLANGDVSTARKMYFELARWVEQKIPQMDPPPNGMTRQQGATQLVFWMSQYVFAGGDAAPLPDLGPDITFTVVQPGTAVTVTTPTKKAGVFIPATAAPEPFTLVVYQDSHHYAENCSGPLETTLCQYPQFYRFEPYPHVTLTTPATFAVCHVNGGDHRLPLPGSDHDQYRLAHELSPNGPYVTGGTVRNTNGESVEVLPLASASFMDCHEGDDVYSSTDGLLERGTRELRRFARAMGRALAPTAAYAIDQGGGGFSLTFSAFNVVDPLGVPDLEVTSTPTNAIPTADAGTSMTLNVAVANVGTATAYADTIQITLTPTLAGQGSPVVVWVPRGQIVPQDAVNPLTFTVPAGTPSGTYTASVHASSGYGVAESNTENNSVSVQVRVTAATTDGPPTAYSLWTDQAPTIDGVFGANEWPENACRSLTVNTPEGTTPGMLCVMNDGTNLYLAVRYARSVSDPGNSASFEFDGDANGVLSVGDDGIIENPQLGFHDLVRYTGGSCPANQLCSGFDTEHDGTNDGAGAFGWNETYVTYELSHPLSSGDQRDFSVEPGGTIGAQLFVRMVEANAAFPAGYGDTQYPADGHFFPIVLATPAIIP